MSRTKESLPLDRPATQAEWEQLQAEELWWSRMEELQAAREVLGGVQDDE